VSSITAIQLAKIHCVLGMVPFQVFMTIRLKNILCLTDFSKASESALQFAALVGRSYRAKIHALHVSAPGDYGQAVPGSIALPEWEEKAEEKARRLASLTGDLAYEPIVEYAPSVWPIVERLVQERQIDMLVAGAYGRTGVRKLALGSVAEEILRRSPVPVLMIGSEGEKEAQSGAYLRRILFTTDFTPDAAAAVPYAVSLAKEHGARLILFHVMAKPDPSKKDRHLDLSVAEVMHYLHETIPEGAELPFPSEVAVEFGDASEQIVRAAQKRDIQMIVMGIRSARVPSQGAMPLGRGVANSVIACGPCPVLAVRARN